jgi:hypothetical protein
MKLEKWEILKKIDLDIFFQKSKFSRQQLGYFLVGFFYFFGSRRRGETY